MDKSYHQQHGHHHHPLSFIATGTPYHSYLSYYGPSSAPPAQRPGSGGNGNGTTGPPLPNRGSANTSNTSSPLSSGYHRPLYRPYQQLSPAYLPYKHYTTSYFANQLSPHHQLHHKEYLNHASERFTKSRNKLQHLSNRLHAWKSVSIAISFLALILLTCKLYDVDREINFLQFIANEWLSPAALNRELLHHTGPPGPVISNSHQPHAQALQAAASTSVNLYSLHNQTHFALPLVISTAPSSNHHQVSQSTKPKPKPQPQIQQPTSAPQQQQHPQPQFSHQTSHITDPNIQNIIFLVDNLREDIDVLIVELWSSRTTLVLSLVFVFVYIMSWCWMAWAIRETTSPHDVSLKTVLLLAIFAAVDIAASAGFVMVRVIMYVMRDHYFPRDLRTPSLFLEYNQLASYTALRLGTLKSSTGVVDIFVSVIVGFLTSLRVYSVICAVAFYRRARKELLNINNLEFILDKPGGGGHHHGHRSSAQMHNSMLNGGGVTRSGSKHGAKFGEDATPPNGYIPKIRLLNAHKDLEHRFSAGGGNGNGNVEPSSLPLDDSATVSSEDSDPATELKIQAADMPPHMQKSAMQSTVHALRTYTTEKHIAESVKQNFDQLYEPTWHCIVGRNWGSCVTHTKSNYIRMLYKDLTILLYKSS